jgi:hypothetical protein
MVWYLSNFRGRWQWSTRAHAPNIRPRHCLENQGSQGRSIHYIYVLQAYAGARMSYQDITAPVKHSAVFCSMLWYIDLKLEDFVANDPSSSCPEFPVSEVPETKKPQVGQNATKSLSLDRGFEVNFLLDALISLKLWRFVANDPRAHTRCFRPQKWLQPKKSRVVQNVTHTYCRHLLMLELLITIIEPGLYCTEPNKKQARVPRMSGWPGSSLIWFDPLQYNGDLNGMFQWVLRSEKKSRYLVKVQT